MLETWPPTLSDAERTVLLRHAVDWSQAHGNVLKAPLMSTTSDTLNLPAIHAPVALFPSPWDRRSFELAHQLQPIFQRLMHAVSLDRSLLKETFTELAAADPFSKRLFDLWTAVINPQKITCGIHRSDYMLHRDETSGSVTLQQVEFNTIAASFAGLSQRTSQLHRYLADRIGYFNESDPSTPNIELSALPMNHSLDCLVDAIAEAWKLYDRASSIVLMVVQSSERNVFDQRWIEFGLWERFRIKMIRRTLAEVSAQGAVVDDKLMIAGQEVSVAYYRAGYGPGDYPSEMEWNARKHIESSLAIKCPSIAYQLVGAKKVQQLLAQPGMLEKYLKDEDEIRLLRSSFAGIFPLDGSVEGEKAVAMALENPDNFVMKPQREGGGNNFYGADIPPKLRELSTAERAGFILMDRIRPPPYRNTLVRQGVAVDADVISELGVYGAYLVDSNGREHMNTAGGHLLRTKTTETNEGGVATGYAVIDSPLLI